MKLPAYDLLKAVVAVRELSLADCRPHLCHKFNDFRDWYPVAGLIKQGYLGNPWIGDAGTKMTEREMASMLYGKTLGEGTHKINNISAVNKVGAEDSIVLFATSATDLYFAELCSKRQEKLWSIVLSIAIGVASALLTIYVKQWAGVPTELAQKK